MDTTDPSDSVPNPASASDWGFRTLLAALLLCAVWLLATPFVPWVGRCLMHRFHLRTSSYWAWAIQQPLPAMYNGRNTTEVRDLPLDAGESGLLDPLLFDPLLGGGPVGEPVPGTSIGILSARTINHFPAREITFANSRWQYLSDRQTKWYVLETTYRHQSLRSVYELKRKHSGEWLMTRLDEP